MGDTFLPGLQLSLVFVSLNVPQTLAAVCLILIPMSHSCYSLFFSIWINIEVFVAFWPRVESGLSDIVAKYGILDIEVEFSDMFCFKII